MLDFQMEIADVLSNIVDLHFEIYFFWKIWPCFGTLEIAIEDICCSTVNLRFSIEINLFFEKLVETL